MKTTELKCGKNDMFVQPQKPHMTSKRRKSVFGDQLHEVFTSDIISPPKKIRKLSVLDEFYGHTNTEDEELFRDDSEMTLATSRESKAVLGSVIDDHNKYHEVLDNLHDNLRGEFGSDEEGLLDIDPVDRFDDKETIGYENLDEIDDDAYFLETLAFIANDKPRSDVRRLNVNDRVLKHNHETVVTKQVEKIAGPLFRRKLATLSDAGAGNNSDGRGEKITHFHVLRHMQDLEKARRAAFALDSVPKLYSISFNRPPTLKQGKAYHNEVNINSTVYKTGDCIMVWPEGSPADVKPNAFSQNGELEPRFARIVNLYRFDNKSLYDSSPTTNFAHVTWFENGKNTTIGELADPHELFETSICEDIHLNQIIAKINLDFRGRTTNIDGLGPITEQFGHHMFFYRLHWQSKFNCKGSCNGVFTAALAPDNLQIGKCRTCKSNEAMASQATPKITERDNDKIKSISILGVTYHLLDCVQVAPERSRGTGNGLPLCKIGQIVGIRNKQLQSRYSTNQNDFEIRIRIFGRYDELLPNIATELELTPGKIPILRDSKRLFRQNKFMRITAKQLDGKLLVQHKMKIKNMESFKDAQNLYLETFWIQDEVLGTAEKPVLSDLIPLPPTEKLYSESTKAEFYQKGRNMRDYLDNAPKLKGFDLFCGAGGLSLSFELSGCATASYALDFSDASCGQFKDTFPRTIVFNQDLSYMLERRLRLDQGEILPPAHDIKGKMIPDLPEKNTVDLIKAGVVCDGMSGRNRYRRADDIKNTLMAAFLSFVDYYRPKYVLIENVKAILSYPLGAEEVPVETAQTKFRLINGITGGVVKFTVRLLTSIGYQVHYTTLQAGQFGTPQSRQRWFLWAAVPGYKLPAFPQPTHCFQGLNPRSMHIIAKTARFPGVSVAEAIGDLMPFQWENPCNIVAKQKEGSKGIKEYKIERDMTYAGQKEQAYFSEPRSEFQRVLRRNFLNVTRSQTVRNHVTPVYYDEFGKQPITERVCNIPIRSYSQHQGVQRYAHLTERRPTHKELNEKLRLRQNAETGLYGRLDPNGFFPCCVGRISPCMTPYSLHPFQNRTISIREFARAQGFPDIYDFKWGEGDTRLQDIITMIGNAVPAFNLGLMVARELLKVEIERWEVTKAQPVVVELD